MNGGLLIARVCQGSFAFRKGSSFTLNYHGQVELITATAFLRIVQVALHLLSLSFVLAATARFRGTGSMLHPYLACYPLIKLLASLCLFEATGRLCKGCLVRDISLVGRGVIAS